MGWSLVSDGFRLLMAGVDFDSADDEEAFLAGALETAHAEVTRLRRAALELNPDGRFAENDRVTSGGDRLGVSADS